MKNSKYIKVPVSEGLPEKSGDNFIIDPNGKKGIGLFINKEFQRLVTPEYWLDEKPDYDDDMKKMLEKIISIAALGEKVPEYMVHEAEELLTKLKTES